MKELIKYFFKLFGYEIQKKESAYGKNPFTAQEKLLANKNVKVIFDVGAHSGKVSLMYNNSFSSANIFAFEPIPSLLEKLENNVRHVSNIRSFQIAISNTKERAMFNVNKSTATSSLLQTNTVEDGDYKSMETEDKIEVPTITLDQFAKNNEIASIDILKMDIQGGELNALKGAEKLLDAGKIHLIYCEVLFENIYKGQPYFSDVFNFLIEKGYIFYNFYNVVSPKNGRIGWADAIFIKKNYLDEQK